MNVDETDFVLSLAVCGYVDSVTQRITLVRNKDNVSMLLLAQFILITCVVWVCGWWNEIKIIQFISVQLLMSNVYHWFGM